MDYFGESSSKHMPVHFFWDCAHLDHASAVRADVSRQNYSVCPRYWYVDGTFECSVCGEAFCFTAAEQRRWYEELGFYVDSYAKDCPSCRGDKRRRKELRKEYDRDIAAALASDEIEQKQRMCDVVDALCAFETDLPERMHANRQTLAKQIAKLGETSDG